MIDAPERQGISILALLWQAPEHILSWAVALLLGVFADPTATSQFAASAALSVVTNIWWGLALFFVLHVLVHIVNAINGAVVTNGRLAGQGALAIAQALQSSQDDTKDQEERPA